VLGQDLTFICNLVVNQREDNMRLRVNLSLPPDVYKAIAEFARNHGIPVATAVKILLFDGIKKRRIVLHRKPAARRKLKQSDRG